MSTTTDARKVELLTMANPVIGVAAKSVARRYHDFVELDDLVQELRMWCWARPEKVEEWLNPPPDPDTGEVDAEAVKRGVKKLGLSMRRRAERMARKERANVLGYRPEDEWFANKGIITELLPIVLAGGYDGYEREGNHGGRSATDPAEGNNKLALLADVTAAWEACPNPVLWALYGNGAHVTRQNVADQLDISLSTVDRREDQALNQMVEFLGGVTPYG